MENSVSCIRFLFFGSAFVLLNLFPLSVFSQTADSDTLRILSQKDSISRRYDLGEVTVVADYKVIKRKADHYILRFEHSPFFANKSIAEALSRAPMIVNNDGVYNIVGKESSLIYINGRPSTISGKDLDSYLSSLPAESVLRVELFTNSSVKLDASNKSGIINIVLKKNNENGLRAQVGGVFAYHNQWREGLNGFLAYSTRQLSLNFFTNLMHAQMRKENMRQYDYDNVSKTVREEFSKVNQTGTPIVATLNAAYTYSEENNIGLVYSISSLNSHQDEVKQGLQVPLSTSSKQNYLGNQIQLYNQHTWGNTSFTGLYSLYLRNNNSIRHHISQYLNIPNNDNNRFLLHTLSADFTTTLASEWQIKYGFKGNKLSAYTEYSWDKLSNIFDYRELIGASYFSAQKNYDSSGVDFGLRFEVMHQCLKNSKRTFRSLFPYLSLYKELGIATYYFNLSQNIDRPSYLNLTASPIYFSKNSKTIGNPNLKSTLTTSIEFGVNVKNWDIMLFGKSINNSIIEYTEIDGDDLVNTYKNLAPQYQIGLNINGSITFSSYARLVLSGMSYYDRTTLYSGNHTNSWNNYVLGKLLINFDRKGLYSLTLSYWNLFPQEEAGAKWKNRGNFTAGIECNLFNKTLKISLKGKDLFNQDHAQYYRKYDGIRVFTHNTFDKRGIEFSVSYQFGNGKKTKKNYNPENEVATRIPTE